MQERMFAIFDIKANAFGRPYFAKTVGLGERMFMDAVNQPDSELRRHPFDFVLYEVGSFDDAEGKLESDHNYPREICTAVSVLEHEEENA